MSRVGLFAVLILAGSIAPCQDTFIVHFDSVQNGYDALGRSVRRTTDGYLVFAHQVSDDGTGRTRCAVYSMGEQGEFQWRHEIGTGEPYHSGFGFFDPVIGNGTGGFRALVQRFGNFYSDIALYDFDDSGTEVSVAPVLHTPDSDSTIIGVRQLRATSDGGLVFCGVVAPPPDWYGDALLVKLDSTGTVQWQRTYDAAGQSHEAISVAPYVDGGYVLAGYRLP